MRKKTLKYLICNLKANKTYYEMVLYKDYLQNINNQNITLILAPSNIYLSLFKDENITLCTQDLSLNENLNLTGDININQLKSLNVKYSIIGHYERRKYYHETANNIVSKIKIALNNDLKVIYCIGETIEELNRKIEYQVLEKQLACVLNNIPTSEFSNIIIAYEPTYLIGTNANYDLDKIKTTINFIKSLVYNYYHENIKVIYGGNLNIDNIQDFNTISELDGYIIGNSSLNPANIQKILENMTYRNE